MDIFPMLIILAVGVTSWMAATGFRGRTTIVGIDLGTTYSVVCVRGQKGGISPVEVVYDFATHSKIPSPLVPSVVSFLPNEEKVLAGSKAKQMIKRNPSNTVYNAKRFIGRDFDDPAVKLQAKEVAFGVVRDVSSGNSGVAFKVPNRESAVPPTHIGKYVLEHLLEMVASHLGHRQVKSAVIAVPAKFNSEQRAATALAFKLAGLKVTRVMEEPTAAALAYGLNRKPNVHHILVYDFGGGTLDVSVLHVSDGFVDVMDSAGDDELGGSDFDARVASFLAVKYEGRIVEDKETLYDECAGEVRGREPMLNLVEEGRRAEGKVVDNDNDENVPLCTLASLHYLAEQLKIAVSTKDSIVHASRRCIGRSGGGGTDYKSNTNSNSCANLEIVELELSKTEFEIVVQPLFDRSMQPIRDVLHQLDMTERDIDEVVMVGGSSRLPQIREMVKAELKAEKLNIEIDPDITVAFGCASVID